MKGVTFSYGVTRNITELNWGGIFQGHAWHELVPFILCHSELYELHSCINKFFSEGRDFPGKMKSRSQSRAEQQCHQKLC